MGFLDDELAKAERRLIEAALASTRKDAERAAAKLGIPPDDLVARVRKLGIPLVVVRRRRPRKWTPEPRRSGLREATRALERSWICEALEAHPDSVRAAAASINMPPSRFYRRLHEFGMLGVPEDETARGRRKSKGDNDNDNDGSKDSNNDSDTPGRRRDIMAALDSLRTRLVREALDSTSGDVAAAARHLGVSRSTLYRLQRSR